MNMKTLILLVAVFLLIVAFPVYAYIPSDPMYSLQSQWQQMNIEKAWDLAKGRGVVVAVLDSGVDIDHPDIKGNIWKNEDEIADDGIDNDGNGYVDDVRGWDFTQGVADPNPKFETGYNDFGMNHGTAVSGIIGAVANNGRGIAGVSFYSKIMPLRILASDGTGSVNNLINAIQYAVNNGADVINLSLVGDQISQNLKTTIKWASDSGVVVVASAGNTDEEGEAINLTQDPTYPACYGDNRNENWVLAVSSVDDENVKSSFASYGRCIDILAPGERLRSLSFVSEGVEGFESYYSSSWSGTSVSAALISGAAALVKSADPSMDASQVIDAILDNAKDLDEENLDLAGELGQGLIDAHLAIASVMGAGHGYLAKLDDVPAVYYITNDGSRHLFSNEAVFWTWYKGGWADQELVIISQEKFDELQLGKNVTARPGADLIKFENSSKIYVVTPGAVICQIDDEGADAFYGSSWQEDRLSIIQNSFEQDYSRNRACSVNVGSRHPSGSVLRYHSNDDIFYIDGNRKRKITTKAFESNGFREEMIMESVNPVIYYYIDGPIITKREQGIFPYSK